MFGKYICAKSTSLSSASSRLSLRFSGVISVWRTLKSRVSRKLLRSSFCRMMYCSETLACTVYDPFEAVRLVGFERIEQLSIDDLRIMQLHKFCKVLE